MRRIEKWVEQKNKNNIASKAQVLLNEKPYHNLTL